MRQRTAASCRPERRSRTDTLRVTAVGLVIRGRVGRLAEARDLIERQDRWRTALVTALAHDVCTPLIAITGALELVAEHDGLSDQLKPLVAAASRQASRLATLSATLLDAERVEQGKLRLDLEPIDLRGVADGAVQLAGHDDTEIDVDIQPGLHVTADRVRLQQMLINLITNARRHGAPPVAIHAHPMDGKVAISVRDHGPGVAAKDEPRLFQRLSPADHAPGSIGLGLWIVRMLAEAHEGEIAYHAGSPGAEFTITLPT
jgi:signal transduction histidine kinase